MTRVDLLPCGDPIDASLFELKDGGRALITCAPVRDEVKVVIPGTVWCVDCGWSTPVSPAEYERLAAVRE